MPTREEIVTRLVRAGELEIEGADQSVIDSYFDVDRFAFHGPDGFESDYAGLNAYFGAIRDAFDERSIRRDLIIVDGRARYVAEHVTRIDAACAPDWPHPPEGRGCHRMIIRGSPNLHVTIHGEDDHEPGPAGGGNTTAANRLVNALPAVCAAQPGVLTPLDLPLISGGPQLRR